MKKILILSLLTLSLSNAIYAQYFDCTAMENGPLHFVIKVNEDGPIQASYIEKPIWGKSYFVESFGMKEVEDNYFEGSDESEWFFQISLFIDKYSGTWSADMTQSSLSDEDFFESVPMMCENYSNLDEIKENYSQFAKTENLNF